MRRSRSQGQQGDNVLVSRRLRREDKTVAAMIRLYCLDEHREAKGATTTEGHDRQLCSACAGLQAYAHERLEHCRFGSRKPTCARCSVHCYKVEMREQVRVVMRHAGPRMATRHPLLALAHLLDRRRA
jgi:hypothetical protein